MWIAHNRCLNKLRKSYSNKLMFARQYMTAEFQKFIPFELLSMKNCLFYEAVERQAVNELPTGLLVSEICH